jgi:acetyl-CoA carboxylase biotin carboxyl carrier protein
VTVPGQQIGIVEAMKLMIPVNADVHATVVKVLRENGTGVEYGERLFALAPVAGG